MMNLYKNRKIDLRKMYALWMFICSDLRNHHRAMCVCVGFVYVAKTSFTNNFKKNLEEQINSTNLMAICFVEKRKTDGYMIIVNALFHIDVGGCGSISRAPAMRI